MNPEPAPTPPESRYDVVVPVKQLDRAKSRLADIGDALRRELVLAFLLDCLDALTGAVPVSRVAVVTDDPVVAEAVYRRTASSARGVLVVPDPAPSELNRALHRGVAALGRSDGGVLAVCADLPALTTDAVEELLTKAPTEGAGFVADRAGVGTTAYLVRDRTRFDPQFGPASRTAHLVQGAVDLSADVSPLLRWDVDTREDLIGLRAWLGPRSARVLAPHENSPLLA